MTAQRQEANGWRPGLAFIAFQAGLELAVALAGLAVLASWEGPAMAQTTERVVKNRYTGLGIAGFDPVSYFTDAAPLPGLPDLEAAEAGVVWRFRNEGNRASFVAHPEVYAPQFGGYDPIDLARGVTYAGNPRFWVISEQRLYLFGREENRDVFATDPHAVLSDAKARWPALEQTLSN